MKLLIKLSRIFQNLILSFSFFFQLIFKRCVYTVKDLSGTELIFHVGKKIIKFVLLKKDYKQSCCEKFSLKDIYFFFICKTT